MLIKNQIVIGGKKVKKSNARELFQSLYWPVRSQNKTDRLALFAALGEIGAPASLILDPTAQKEYAHATHVQPSPLRSRSQPARAVTSSATPPKGKGRKRALLSVLAAPSAKRRARPPGTRLLVLRLNR